jgi:DNA-binding SARP family transcriptional activator
MFPGAAASNFNIMNRGSLPPGSAFQYALLGPLTVHRHQVLVEVAGPLPRAVLTVLLLHPNETVSVDRLTDAVWGARRPASAVQALRNHVMRLRSSLGDKKGVLIRTRKSGYAITVLDGERDLDTFAALCDRGRTALREHRWEQAHRDLTAALALWRAEPLAEIRTSGDEIALRLHALREARLAAFEGQADALLGMGADRDAVGLLRPLAEAHPLHEQLHRRLMLALYRCGRRAEALAAYHLLRRALARELGVEPSREVSTLQGLILSGLPPTGDQGPGVGTESTAEASGAADRRLWTPDTAVATADKADEPASAGDARTTTAASAPDSLATPHLVGRAKEIRILLSTLTSVSPRPGTGPVIVVSGGAGVGKTALARHTAGSLASVFPGGQILITMSGPRAVSEDPADVLGKMLVAMGVDAAHVPRGVEPAAAMVYRLTSERRVLFLLDDAADMSQALPVLAVAEDSAVLITSRDCPRPGAEPLPAMVPRQPSEPFLPADHGVGPHPAPEYTVLCLGPLPPDAAAQMLGLLAGSDRLAAAPEATARVLDACAGHPLALRLAGERMKARPQWPVQALADLLADARGRLVELRVGEFAVRTAIRDSYLGLPPATGAERMFRLLGLLDEEDISIPAAAVLGDMTRDEAEVALDALEGRHLVLRSHQDRFRLPDLVRDFARALTECLDTADERDQARSRLLGWHEQAAEAIV